jgi:hypothetical protein
MRELFVRTNQNYFPALLVRGGGLLLMVASGLWLLVIVGLGLVSAMLTSLLQSIAILGAIMALISFIILMGIFVSILGIFLGYFFFRISYDLEDGIGRQRRDLLILLAVLILVLSLLVHSWLSFLASILVTAGLLLARTQFDFNRKGINTPK